MVGINCQILIHSLKMDLIDFFLSERFFILCFRMIKFCYFFSQYNESKENCDKKNNKCQKKPDDFLKKFSLVLFCFCLQQPIIIDTQQQQQKKNRWPFVCLC